MTETPDQRGAPGSPRAAGAWLCLLALLLGSTGWLFTSALVSFVDPLDPDTVDYVLAGRSSSQLALWCLGALGVLAVWQAVCARRLLRLPRWQDGFAWSSVAPLAPLLLLALPLGAVAMLATPLGAVAPPWIYLFVDLRWWLLAAIVALLAATTASFSVPSRPGVWEFLTVVTLLTAALAFSPKDRFDAAVVGDEPKYVRYLENWYRGRGMDIDNLVPIQKLPIDYQPQISRNFRHAGEALSIVVADLASDLRRLAGLAAPPRPEPATSHGDAFIEGKRGGVYQVHNPGLSLLLFPGYFLDRFALTWASHSFAQGPAHLYATNVVMLSLYLLWGIALFRWLSAHTTDAALSFAITCIALLSLPATAFAYQYYPEVAGGLFIVVVARYVAMPTGAGFWPAFGYGVLAGCLPWLHVRFGYAAIVAGVLMTVGRTRSARQAVAGFWAGVAFPIGLLCLYSYHLTGSLLPFKVWELMLAAEPGTHVIHPAAARRLAGLWLDFDWGLVAHAPVYLLALAGMWPLWQHSRRLTMLVALLVVPLVLQSAAYNWHGSGTTPLRIVTAIVPILSIPLAAAFLHFRRSRWFLVAFAVLTAISIDNGLSFNSHFDRARPVLGGPTIGGWLSRLDFPHLDTPDWLLNPLVLFWIAVSAVVLLWPAIRARPEAGRDVWSWTSVTAMVLVGLAAGSSAIGAWTGVSRRARFLNDYADARDTALRFHLAHEDGTLWSARRGRTRLEAVFPNPSGVEITVSSDSRVALVHGDVAETVGARGPDGTTAWGTFVVDFGDGRRAGPLALMGTAVAHHAYATPGDYQETVIVSMPGVAEVRREHHVKVIPPDLIGLYGLERIPGLPAEFRGLPVTVAIDRVTLTESRIELQCSASGQVAANAAFWVWLIGYEQGNLRARLYVAPSVPAADDLRRFVLAIVPGPIPDPGRPTTLIVGAAPTEGSIARFRSSAFSFPWPAPELTSGSPIVVTAAEAR